MVPVLESARLRLRGFEVTDHDAIHHLWSDPETNKYIKASVQSKEDSWRKILAHIGLWTHFGFGFWVVEELTSQDFVGIIGFSNYRRALDTDVKHLPEMGWILNPKKQGQGYGLEGGLAALKWLAGESYCIVSPNNLPSDKLAKKLGFKLYQSGQYKNQPINIYHFKNQD